jgi:uncharacterized protein
MRLLMPALLLLLVTGCGGESPRPGTPAGPPPEPQLREDGSLTFYRPDEGDIVTIAIEIADTEEAIQRGLMGRQSLPPRTGMLFLMPQTRIQSFWMANTPLSLDITFVAPDSTIINTAKYTRPFSSESHASLEPARYVIETPAGFTDSHGITPGDRVRWTRAMPNGE